MTVLRFSIKANDDALRFTVFVFNYKLIYCQDISTITMETQILGLGVYYDHTKIDDKHFFGGFLNSANNNIELLITAYCKKFDPTIKGLNPVQFPDVCFKKNDSDTDFQKKLQFVRK